MTQTVTDSPPACLPADQRGLWAFAAELTPEQRRRLAAEIAGLDFTLLNRLAKAGPTCEDWEALARRAAPPTAFRLPPAVNGIDVKSATRRGATQLAAGKVGAILVAGGQGTRLGFEHPKGMFPLGPVSGATLFQILIEKLLAVGRRHGVRIPLYLMTSPATHEETVAFLDAHARFGLPTEDLRVFCQGTMPAVDAATGRVLLAEKGELALSPDGHGGMLAALADSGGLDDASSRGIEQLFYMQIDNPLVQVCDEAFLGYHLLASSELSTQVVAKRGLRDKLGNVVEIDGAPRIIEYSDLNHLPDDILSRGMAEGRPVFWAGSTAIHIFDLDFLRRARRDESALPFHIAKKKVPYIDAQGKRVEPTEPNAIKFERFIFDLLPAARRAIVMEIDPRREFQPLKNADGEPFDTPTTVRQAMTALHTEWLAAVGANVSPGTPVEISPLFADSAAECARRVPPGTTVDRPTYFV